MRRWLPFQIMLAVVVSLMLMSSPLPLSSLAFFNSILEAQMRHSSEMLGVVRDQNRALLYGCRRDQAINILEQIAFGVKLLPDSRGGVERTEF